MGVIIFLIVIAICLSIIMVVREFLSRKAENESPEDKKPEIEKPPERSEPAITKKPRSTRSKSKKSKAERAKERKTPLEKPSHKNVPTAKAKARKAGRKAKREQQKKELRFQEQQANLILEKRLKEDQAKREMALLDARLRAAGDLGEEIVYNITYAILNDDDYIFRNVVVSYQDRIAEMDIVIVNKKGVFIIEVKNYSGCLQGGAENKIWQKCYLSRNGIIYLSTLTNPIRQLRRQKYILAHYFKYFGVNARIEGYTYLIHNNSPIEHECILTSPAAIDHAIHYPRNYLTVKEVDKIVSLLA